MGRGIVISGTSVVLMVLLCSPAAAADMEAVLDSSDGSSSLVVYDAMVLCICGEEASPGECLDECEDNCASM